MKLRKTKKGFTVVELVIVIAVIAVLAAILIPTFISLDSRAKKASDQSLVKNLNTALAAQEGEADDTPNDTMHDAVLDLKKWGYDVDALVTKSGEDLLWNSKDNRFYLSKEVESAKTKTEAQDVDFWKVQNAYNGESTYSVYASGTNFSSTVTNLKVGFDAGYNMNIQSITYQRESTAVGQTVKIRTNGGDLVLNSPNDSVLHFGSVENLTVTAIKKNSSYHENGIVTIKATLISGTIDVESDGYIREIDTTGAEAGSTINVDGYVSTVTASAGESAVVATSGSGYVANNGGAAYGNASSLDTTINNVGELQQFKARVNDGYSFAGLTVKLAADLDISAIPWEPIGNKKYAFVGTFDGQNHTIKGLTNKGFEVDPQNDLQPSTYSGNYGSSYGFFGVIGGTEGNATIVKNLSLTDVAININLAKNLGGLFGSDAKAFSVSAGGGNITIQNVSVKGEIKSTSPNGVTLGGIGGKVYNPGRVDVIDCKNYANLIAKDATGGDVKVAGIIGFISESSGAGDGNVVVLINNCKNFGNMDAKTLNAYVDGYTHGVWASGIANKSWGKVYINNCSTQGKTVLEAPNADILYSAIGRVDAYDCWELEQVAFEGVTYKKYSESWASTFIFGANNTISNDAGFDAFNTRLVDDRLEYGERVIESLLDSELFYLYNCLPSYPWNPDHHA